MTKLTSAMKRKITEDWHKLFPQMDVYQPMWLARRVGPLVQGICLERDSINASYLPTTHLHNLCRPFPVLSLTMTQWLLTERSGVQEPIAIPFHERHYEDAARRLAAACLLPLSGDLTVGQVLVAYRAYRGLSRPDSRYPVLLFEDSILLAAWSGQTQRAEVLLDECVREMARWPANVMARWGGADEWRDKMFQALGRPEALREAAETHAQELKVTDLPGAQLLT